MSQLLKTVLAAEPINTDGTDLLIRELSSKDLTKARELIITGKITGGASSAGTVTVWWSWSNIKLPVLDAANLATLTLREQGSGPITITANHDKQYRFSGMNSTLNPLRRESDWLYFWIDRASTAGNNFLTLELRRLPSTAVDYLG